VLDLGDSGDVITGADGWTAHGSYFSDINDKGEVGGALVVSSEKVSPAVWSTEAKPEHLASGRFGGAVRALNSSGLAVGVDYQDLIGLSDTNEGLRLAWLPAAWRNGEPLALEIPASVGAESATFFGTALDTNENDQIVGYFSDPSLGRSQPVIWRDGAIETVLPVADAGKTLAYYINAAGTVAGAVEYSQGFSDGRASILGYPFIWRVGNLEILDLPDSVVIPRSLDEKLVVDLQVLGLSDSGLFLAIVKRITKGEETVRSYLIDRGTWTSLPSPSDSYPEVLAQSISPTGIVVGIIGADRYLYDRRLAVWFDGSPSDITDSVLDLGDLKVNKLLAVNGHGAILADAYDADHAYHGLVLTPN
jgi:hypothetical protein